MWDVTILNEYSYLTSYSLCEKGILFEVEAKVTLAVSWYVCDSKTNDVVCWLVDHCHVLMLTC